MKYCPQCGGKLQEEFRHGRYRPVCENCGFVIYLDPKVGAGVIVEIAGRVVLVRRAMEPKRGWWSLPSGFVEYDERPEEAAVREAREETGLEVELDNLLGVYSFGREAGSRGVLVLYAAHVVSGELRAGDDAQEVGLFGPEELPADIAFVTHDQALREWRRAQAIVYRQATEAEMARVRQLSVQHRTEIGIALPLDTPSAESALFVALDKEEVVGFAHVVVHRWNATANISLIFVLAGYRRWGIATHLIAQAMAYARTQGLRTLLAEAPATNPVLVVYLRAGFRAAGFIDAYYPPEGAERGTVLFLAYDLD